MKISEKELLELVESTKQWGWRDHLSIFGSAAVFIPDEIRHSLGTETPPDRQKT